MQDGREKPPDARPDSPDLDEEGEAFAGMASDGHTRRQLYDRAKALDIPGRSRMSKPELARAIARKQD